LPNGIGGDFPDQTSQHSTYVIALREQEISHRFVHQLNPNRQKQVCLEFPKVAI
jgi:hypothetical protein